MKTEKEILEKLEEYRYKTKHCETLLELDKSHGAREALEWVLKDSQD